VSFEIDGMMNRFVVKREYNRYIGKFEKQEDQEHHVWVRPPSPGGITGSRFGRNNLHSLTGGAMQPGDVVDLTSLMIDGEGNPFSYNFGDLLPISYSVPDFNIQGTSPAYIGYVALLWDRRDSPPDAVMAGAQAFVEAMRDGLNELIENYQHDFTDYIN
jgi:hypothetical protein